MKFTTFVASTVALAYSSITAVNAAPSWTFHQSCRALGQPALDRLHAVVDEALDRAGFANLQLALQPGDADVNTVFGYFFAAANRDRVRDIYGAMTNIPYVDDLRIADPEQRIFFCNEDHMVYRASDGPGVVYDNVRQHRFRNYRGTASINPKACDPRLSPEIDTKAYTVSPPASAGVAFGIVICPAYVQQQLRGVVTQPSRRWTVTMDNIMTAITRRFDPQVSVFADFAHYIVHELAHTYKYTGENDLNGRLYTDDGVGYKFRDQVNPANQANGYKNADSYAYFTTALNLLRLQAPMVVNRDGTLRTRPGGPLTKRMVAVPF